MAADHATLTAPDFPRRVEIEIASACNLRCVYCPRRHLDPMSGLMDFSLFASIIGQIKSRPETVVVLHRRGESLMHPRFAEMLALVEGKFVEVQMATNATLLTQDKFEPMARALTFVSFSLDTPERYEKTRIPARYAKVEENILRFLEHNKGRARTQASMVRTADASDEECERFEAIWRGRVDRVRIYAEHSGDGRFGSLASPRGERLPCAMPFYELLIADNGEVGRCNHDWKPSGLGDLRTATIAAVWNSPAYEALRDQHRSLRFTDPTCASCDSWYPRAGDQGTGKVAEK